MLKSGAQAELTEQLTRSLGHLATIDDLHITRVYHYNGQSVVTGSAEPLSTTMESHQEEFTVDGISCDRFVSLVRDKELLSCVFLEKRSSMPNTSSLYEYTFLYVVATLREHYDF